MSQQKIDIGIFERVGLDTLVLKCRPNYNTPANYYITNIQFTIKWPESSSVTQLQNITSTVNSFYQITPQQAVTNGGYRYQVYSMVGAKNITWIANQEYPVLEVKINYPGGCTDFEISSDTYTIYTLNGSYYISIVGSNKTGILYKPSISLQSIGGSVSGSETICLGSSTSVMTLSGHSGSILGWQKKRDAYVWRNISGTAGMTQYFSTPDSAGTYQYRARVQRSSCLEAYSTNAVIGVEARSSWRGASDTLWSNAANWNVCGVPDLLKDAEIAVAASGKYPTVTSPASCKSLVILSGARLKILKTASLNVGGVSLGPIRQ
jgi:hypothetical protein